MKAQLVDDVDDPNAPPGAFEYFKHGDRDPAGLIYNCPCGCGTRGSLDFRPHDAPSWDWDGNVEAPTLHPSVHHIIRTPNGVRTHWHGWLRKGEWVSV